MHFLRFELSADMVSAVKSGAGIDGGVDHQNYDHRVDDVPPAMRDSLAADLASVN